MAHISWGVRCWRAGGAHFVDKSSQNRNISINNSDISNSSQNSSNSNINNNANATDINNISNIYNINVSSSSNTKIGAR